MYFHVEFEQNIVHFMSDFNNIIVDIEWRNISTDNLFLFYIKNNFTDLQAERIPTKLVHELRKNIS